MRYNVLSVFLLVAILASSAAAQDSHYWDNQYGTKGELLGGLVVGNPADLSATFYNPGWVALRISPGLLLTTMAGEIYNLKVKDASNGEEWLSATTSSKSPGYLAGRFSTGNDKGWKWAYSYLQKVKFKISTSATSIYDFEAPLPEGQSSFSGESYRTNEANEYWYGVTVSRKLSENLGLGFTPYGVYRSMKKRTQLWAQALGGNNNLAQVYDVDQYDMWHFRMLCKIGLAYQQGRLNLGLTVTTPSLGIMGKGSVYQSLSLSGLDADGNGAIDDPYLASNYQEDLDTSWKSPLSIAAGANWTWGKTGLFLTVEWFNSVATSQAMEPADYTSQSGDGTVVYEVHFGSRSLFNYGLGLNHTVSEKFALYGAFRSDYSSVPRDQFGFMQTAIWDLWHATGGVSFSFKNIDLTAGVEYGFGSEKVNDFHDFGNDNGDVIDYLADSEITYRRLKGLIGFNLPF